MRLSASEDLFDMSETIMARLATEKEKIFCKKSLWNIACQNA